jgi:hypothetical protein
VSDRAIYRLGAVVLALVLGVQLVATGGAVAPAGVVLELTGIAIALWGLGELSADLFPNRPLPHRAGWRWVKRRIGIKPPRRVVEVGAVIEVDAAGRARGQSTKPRPSDAASLAEWNAYWDSRLENLAKQIGWVRQDMKAAGDDLARRISDETSDRSSAIAELHERLRMVAGGEGGRGLTRAWWGFVLTFFGVLLQGLG